MQSWEKKAILFKALGDPTRVRIMEMLCSSGALCVSAIAERIGARQPTISQHLKILKSCGLVSSSRQGFRIHYRIDGKKLEELHRMVLGFADSRGGKRADSSCPDGPVHAPGDAPPS